MIEVLILASSRVRKKSPVRWPQLTYDFSLDDVPIVC